MDELILTDHVRLVIDAFIARLKLGEFGFARASPAVTGRPPYDRADLLKLYVYGSFQQVRSSHRLEAECKRIVEVMWRIFGRPRFLMRGRRGTSTEIAIDVLGYNLKQALRALRPAGLIGRWRTASTVQETTPRGRGVILDLATGPF